MAWNASTQRHVPPTGLAALMALIDPAAMMPSRALTRLFDRIESARTER